MLLGDHRVLERIVLVVELDDRARQLRAFLDAEALGQRAGGDVAHHHFERDDLDFADQLLAHVHPADEMGRDADRVEMVEDELGDPVVQDPLAIDNLMLLGVEGSCIILEVLDERTRFRALIEDLALALVNAPAAVHRHVPCLRKKIHIGGDAPVDCGPLPCRTVSRSAEAGPGTVIGRARERQLRFRPPARWRGTYTIALESTMKPLKRFSPGRLCVRAGAGMRVSGVRDREAGATDTR